MRYMLIMILIFLMSGCFSNEEKDLKDTMNLYEVCKDSGRICNTLVADSLCKNLRRDVIIGNYAANTVEDMKLKEKYQYELLVDIESYVSCSKKSTFIEYDYDKFERADLENERKTPLSKKEIEEREKFKENLKEREQKRNQNYIFANYMLRGLNQKTKMSSNPYLLYWHWSRNGNEDSINKLEELYKNNQIKSSRLYYYLSQYYSKFNEEESITLMYKALENMPKEDYVNKISDDKQHDGDTDGLSIHFPIFRALTTYYYNQGDIKKSYIFAKLLEEKNDNTANIIQIARLFENEEYNSTINELENVIEDVNESLENGNFKRNIL